MIKQPLMMAQDAPEGVTVTAKHQRSEYALIGCHLIVPLTNQPKRKQAQYADALILWVDHRP